MVERVTELYEDADLARMRRKVTRWTVGLILFGGAALAVCLLLAVTVNTQNAMRRELVTISVSVAAGWLVIYDGIFEVAAGRHEISHAQMLRTDPRTRLEGEVTVTKERMVIRKSVAVRRVKVALEGGPKWVLVCESKAKALQSAGASAVYVANGYVAAYEVSL